MESKKISGSSEPIRRTRMPVGVLAGLFLAASHPALALTEKAALTLGDVAFYTFGLTATALSLAIVVAYRAYSWVSYVGFALFILLTIASMDGSLLVLLNGGEFTLWVVPFLCYTLCAAYGYWVVAVNLEEGHRVSSARIFLLGLAILSALLALSSVLWLRRIPLNLMWMPANFLFVGMLLSQCLPPLTWSDLGNRLSAITRLFPVVLGAYYAVVLFVEFAQGGWGQATLNELNRIGLLLYASFAVVVVIGRAFASAKKQEDAERRALQLAQREAELQASLLEAERDFQRAKRLATEHQSQLAAVSHDLKQPISALRIAIDGLPAEFSNRDRFHQAVDYIGSLAHAFLEHESPTPSDDEGLELVPEENGKELVASSVFASSLEQMFETEASSKGINLRVYCGRQTLHVHPLRTMRIMSNLIGNALAHSGATRIVIGFRRSTEGVVFQVHDNGVGMSAELLNTVQDKRSKGADSEGHGLGLAIVKELCDEQGLGFEIKSRPEHGTSAYLSLPDAHSNLSAEEI